MTRIAREPQVSIEPISEALKPLSEPRRWVSPPTVLQEFEGRVIGLEFVHRPHFQARLTTLDEIDYQTSVGRWRRRDVKRNAKITVWAHVQTGDDLEGSRRIWVASHSTESFTPTGEQLQAVADAYDGLMDRVVRCETSASLRRGRVLPNTEFTKVVSYY